MASVVEGGQTMTLDPLVKEAIETLGFFRPEAVKIIADRIARLWGNNDYTFANDGERIRPFADEPKRLISREVWECLSDRGREDPAFACKATLLRVSFGVYRLRDAASFERRRSVASVARFAGVTQYTCAAGRACEGKHVSLRRRALGLFERDVRLPELPLSDCAAAWCACRWDLIDER